MFTTLPFTVFAFVFTLGIVIIVHELGHFMFCKLFGIYVKTFSIGIGPRVLKRRVGETDYVLSLIPFGGYVKMAGEGIMEEIQDAGTLDSRKYPLGTEQGNREAAAGDLHIPTERHFNNRPLYQRLLVFVAGPLFNLVLAFVVYAGIVLEGGVVEIPVTRVGGVLPDSPAAAAGFAVGDRILEVDGKPVALWDEILQDIVTPSLQQPDDPRPVRLAVLRSGRVLDLDLTPHLLGEQGPWSVGLEPWDTEVGLVQKEGPAARLGLRTGDKILSVDGQSVTSFNAIARLINDRGGQETRVVWLREGRRMEGTVTPELAEIAPDSSIGRIFIDRQYINRPVGLAKAVSIGVVATWRTMEATLQVLYNFFGGKLGLEAVGGPIRIGQVAGEMLRWSFGHLMQFIAFFSVNLFLLNLLPIPVLDGGHVLFLLVELVMGRQVPERIQAIATQVGLITLLLFMTFVVVIDVLKVTGH